MKKHVQLLALLLGLACATAQAEEPRKIAFVDTGNTGRSLTAESIANALIAQKNLKIAVISRAVDMDPFDARPEANAAALLQQRGIDVRSHVATQLSSNDVRHADLILTMTAKHKAKVLEQFPEAKAKTYTLAEYASSENRDIADAWGKPMAVYEDMFKQMDQLVPAALDKSIAK
ncbi:hypothetical protein [Vogesella sp. LIG4]|uniref:arsenate reductase/protein-tyrosine-phosphatase family protein n=1 Tax=Vogesella sp. LIG4 TaxID=1192162 RepID=UPI00081FD217|nr:hypothetical protein [Vogesella sp. LIG4]SCK07802.1 protein-tyrosine phosphatase [Vogesella sp. LIG4]